MDLTPSELAALRQFLQTIARLPLWEWGSVPILLALSFYNQPVFFSFLIMAVTFVVVLARKISAMKVLERELRGVFYFVRGYHKTLSGAARFPLIGTIWFVPKLIFAALISMPSFFEAMTGAAALPKAYDSWNKEPDAAEKFVDLWRSTVPEIGRRGLPGILFALLVILTVIQASAFARFILEGLRRLEAVRGKACQTV